MTPDVSEALTNIPQMTPVFIDLTLGQSSLQSSHLIRVCPEVMKSKKLRFIQGARAGCARTCSFVAWGGAHVQKKVGSNWDAIGDYKVAINQTVSAVYTNHRAGPKVAGTQGAPVRQIVAGSLQHGPPL